MTFFFTPLQKSHFPLLLKWLESPHVKVWWDPNVQWTPQLIKEKYGTYVQGYKIEKGVRKPIQAYIICLNDIPMGYVQLYNIHNFAEDYPDVLEGLPDSLAALDFFVGEKEFLGKGLTSIILQQFLKEYVDPSYEACFVDPDTANIIAIRAYEKAGFKIIQMIQQGKVTWMLKVKGL